MSVPETANRPEKRYEDRPWLDPRARPIIDIKGVTKQFGSFTAVHDVDLRIFGGELFALLGGSGCGKTTLLRMLAGFERPTMGRIEIDGVDMTDLPPYERPVNMMFQSYALFPHMTVERNIAYGLKHENLTKQQAISRVADMLDLVQLGPFAKRKPHQLSGGQRQRVALARALVKQPKVLLLDEPLAALDKKLREQTQFELINIQDKVGITFVVVTHDQEEAMNLSTRIAVMDRGQIMQIGTPTDIYEFPETRFTADFIGSINVFAGRIVEDRPDHVIVASEESGCDLYIDYGVSIRQDTTVWIAVRPEKIAISKSPPADAQYNTVSGVVLDLGYFGNHSLYRIRLESGKVIQVSRQNERRSSRSERNVEWDDVVYLSWEASSAIVLTE
jgi:putrescine transport system ATP-binding protein